MDIQLGYKVKLVSILNGKEQFRVKKTPLNLSADLLNWLKELKTVLIKDDEWLDKKIKTLYDARIFEFQTMFDLPEIYYDCIGFKSQEIQNKLNLKKETYRCVNDTAQREDIIYQEHKYFNVPNLKTLFRKGNGYTKAFNYFVKGFEKKKVSLKDIEMYKEEIYEFIKKDIKQEQSKVHEPYPSFRILKNAGLAIVQTFPGLVEHLYPGKIITLQEKQKKVLNYLIRKSDKNIPFGVLFELFHFEN